MSDKTCASIIDLSVASEPKVQTWEKQIKTEGCKIARSDSSFDHQDQKREKTPRETRWEWKRLGDKKTSDK